MFLQCYKSDPIRLVAPLFETFPSEILALMVADKFATKVKHFVNYLTQNFGKYFHHLKNSP